MYIEFIPTFLYTPIYFHFLMVVTLYTFISLQQSKFKVPDYGHLILILILIYMGMRPISGHFFGDMRTYANYFAEYQAGAPVTSEKDVLFHWFMRISSQVVDVHTFFLICSVLYIYPLYFACKKWFRDYWFLGFLMLAGSFSFWVYGTNGIRNGIATSVFLFAASRERKVNQYLWMALAIGVHKSLLLPALGWFLTNYQNRPRLYFYFWLLTIPLSLAMPGFWQSLFSNLVEDERAEYFSDTQFAEQFSEVGFRWDFLLYSCMGVIAGWYYIFKEKVQDELYLRLFNTFLFANGFWILVIQASFSNRFAYLSWFMMAIIIAYPFLRIRFLENQGVKFGLIMFGYFLFTYIMNILVY